MVNRQVECIVYMFDDRAIKGGEEALQQIAGFKYLVDAIVHRQYRYRNFKSRWKGKKYAPKLIMLVANKADRFFDETAMMLWQQERIGEHKIFDAFRDPLLGFRYGNSFSVLYDDVTTLSIFGELEVDVTKRLVIGGNAQFNSFTTNQRAAWNLPELEAGIFGKYKNDKWYASANLFFVGERQDLLVGTFPLVSSSMQTLDAFTDLNLNGGYHFNDFVSVFVKLNNVLNNSYERFANYNVQGFQVLGGVTYKFDF